MSLPNTLLGSLANDLFKSFSGEIHLDPAHRTLYSTDASIYQIMPLGVAIPRTQEDIVAAVELAAKYNIPILPRGSGSSLAGQAVGEALVVDCSKYLNHILEIDLESESALVEPGVVLNTFNKAAAAHRLQFGPDPASSDRATFGGMVGNNSTGAHSILYGMTSDNLLSADVLLSDGSPATFEQVSLTRAAQLAEQDDAEGRFYRAALTIRERDGEAIKTRWPRTWRRASGYSVNYLLPWSSSRPPQWAGDSYPPIAPDHLNLAPVLVGSEGTLAIFQKLRVRLVKKPRHTILGVMSFESIAAACDATTGLLALNPSAVELIPQALIRLARAVPAYAQRLSFVRGDPAALLVVEFSGDDPHALKDRVRQLGDDIVIAESAAEQEQVWAVRKVGLGLLMSRPGDVKPLPFMEDIAVPVERLGEYVREVERILARYGTSGDFYAHASAGCLHMRPLLNLKTIEGVDALRSIAAEAVQLTLRLGGALSGEHGDGLSHSEWLESFYGTQIAAAFRDLKRAADPENILNPGKIVDGPPMDANLRYSPAYRASGWQPVFDFTNQASLAGAIEMCNGAGVCRKDGGVMCPSYQATRDEMHSTRGRANLLRSMISGAFPVTRLAETAVHEALDLCLECKGCKAECPSAVDMAKLKYEFLNRYYSHNRRPVRDYLFAYIGPLARFGRPFAPIANPLLGFSPARAAADRFLGLARQRALPKLSRQRFASNGRSSSSAESVIFLSDPFTEYFYPEIAEAALGALRGAGCAVHILPVVGAGRTLISKGFLKAAKDHAAKVIRAISALDPDERMDVIGVEPSEHYTLRDEYRDLFPGDARVASLDNRSFLLDEFLLRPGPDGLPRMSRLDRAGEGKSVLLHGHCYQKAQPPAADGYPVGVPATVAFLSALGFSVSVIDSGCCGMAGSFGYESKHYDLSMQIGEMALFPAIRAARPDQTIVASGVSCRAQIESGTARRAIHPATLITHPITNC